MCGDLAALSQKCLLQQGESAMASWRKLNLGEVGLVNNTLSIWWLSVWAWPQEVTASGQCGHM